MTKEWKAGDLAMVEIEGTTTGDAYVCLKGGGGGFVSRAALLPLPTAMTAAEKALIDACIEEGISSGVRPFIEAVKAERAPPDPVEVAIAAFLNSPGNTVEGIRAALKAYDAAKAELTELEAEERG